MHDTGCLGLVHWDDLEGWDGEGGGRGDQDGERMYTHCRFKLMYGKTKTILYCKVKLKKKKKLMGMGSLNSFWDRHYFF